MAPNISEYKIKFIIRQVVGFDICINNSVPLKQYYALTHAEKEICQAINREYGTNFSSTMVMNCSVNSLLLIIKELFSRELKLNDSIKNAAQSGAASEVVGRYGSAVKEHYVAYSGRDNEYDINLTRGLKKTAESKVNPEYKKQNLRQQSGFAAEDKYTARKNSEAIINKSKERYVRTDDLGRVNDPLYDHVKIDENGFEIVGSGEQMKFVGNNPYECLQKLKSGRYQKYIDADAKITVPKDFYKEIHKEIDSEIDTLSNQLEHAQKNRNQELQHSLETRIKKLKKIKRNLRDSGITNKEALEARINPRISTAKDIVKLSHRARVEQAKIGVAVGGGLSLITNLVGVCKGDITPQEAAKRVVKETGKGAITAYTTAFAGSALKGTMQNSSSSMVRQLSKTNLPATMVTSVIDISKTMKRYINGEISGTDCLIELGQKGTSQLSSAMFAGVGQALIPIPVVGAMIGSIIGYALSSTFYGQLVNALREKKISYERRIKAEKECDEAIRMATTYRAEMQRMLDRYLSEHRRTFTDSFVLMDEALSSNDIDKFIEGANNITKKLNGTPTFENISDFTVFMNDSNSILIL